MTREETAVEAPLDVDQQPVETSQAAVASDGTATPGTAIAPTVSGGAPALNLNSFGAGLESDPEIGQRRLALGTLPPSLARVERAAFAFRRALEGAVVLAHGDIDFLQAALIQSASRWERHAGLALRWLRDNHEKLDPAERLSYSREVAKASSERDKAIAQLRLSAADRKTLLADISVPAA